MQKCHPECTKMHHFPLRSQKFFWGEAHSLPIPHPLIACKLKQSFIGQAVVQAAWQWSVISLCCWGWLWI